MAFDFDITKTLDELEGTKSEKPDFNSHLAQTCYKLQQKPLNSFTPEDLRIMIGQKIGLKYLVPLAVELLEKDPLTEGDFFPGDLMLNVARIKPEFWQAEAVLREKVKSLIGLVIPKLAHQKDLQRDLSELSKTF